MATLSAITGYLDRFLNHSNIRDYAGAQNGLQVENDGRVARVCAAVDACETVFNEASRVPGTLLLVHHGLMWAGAQPFIGALRRKLRVAFDANLAVYSSHLPLDLHRTVGNNALLAKLIGMRAPRAAIVAQGQHIGLVGTLATSRAALARALEDSLDTRVLVAPGGTERIRRVGICSGGAGAEVVQVAALGCDTYITGEGPHHTYTLAEELGVNLIYAGHYATETLGVRALAGHVAKKFRLPWSFIHHPTGL